MNWLISSPPLKKIKMLASKIRLATLSTYLFDTHVNFEKFLHRHLTDEEEIIVPLILEYDPDLQH
jgi:hypothetical protein